MPQQALALTNGELTLEAGRAIATNLRQEIARDKLVDVGEAQGKIMQDANVGYGYNVPILLKD